jgi:hypothetical protein
VSATDPLPEEQVRGLARSCVRAGLLSTEEMHAEVVGAITTDLPERAADADELAATWLAEAHDELRADQRDWPESTDYERLQSAFAELEMLDVSVLQGCQDEASARRVLADTTSTPRGVAWFTPADIRRAVDEGVLALHLLHGPGSEEAASDEAAALAAADGSGDELAADVLGVLEKHGLRGRLDQGRVEVDALWQKPIAS